MSTGPCFPQYFIVEMFKHTEKLKEFYSGNQYSLSAINILLYYTYCPSINSSFFMRFKVSFRYWCTFGGAVLTPEGSIIFNSPS